MKRGSGENPVQGTHVQRTHALADGQFAHKVERDVDLAHQAGILLCLVLAPIEDAHVQRALCHDLAERGEGGRRKCVSDGGGWVA